MQVNITNTSNLPVEAIEMEYPLRVEEYALVEDSGGAGTYRGGMGIRRSIRPVDHQCEFNGVGERFRNRPWGIFGGKPGAHGAFAIKNDDGIGQSLPAKATCVKLTPSTTVVIETPGAGGYGPPSQRHAAAVTRDRESGKFSKRYLASNYAK